MYFNTIHDYPNFNPTGQWCPSGNCQACLLGAGQTVLIATQNSPKQGE